MVQTAEAMPREFVVTGARSATDPPPAVTVNVTATPATGSLLASTTLAPIGVGNAVPTVPVCTLPEATPMAVGVDPGPPPSPPEQPRARAAAAASPRRCFPVIAAHRVLLRDSRARLVSHRPANLQSRRYRTGRIRPIASTDLIVTVRSSSRRCTIPVVGPSAQVDRRHGVRIAN